MNVSGSGRFFVILIETNQFPCMDLLRVLFSAMKRLLLLPLLCLALVFGLTACDSGGSNGDDTEETNNEFSLNVTPKSSTSESATAKALRDTTIEGFSFFFSGQDSDGDDAFAIYFNDSESFSNQNAQDGLFGFLARETLRPDEGTYDVDNPDVGLNSGSFVGVLYEDFGDDGFQDAPFYIPQGSNNSFTIDTSNEDEVSGSVDIPNAFAITFDLSTTPASVDTTEVSITGSFTAKNVDDFAAFATP